MTHRQKTVGVTAAVVVSVFTFTTYNPIGDRTFSSSTSQSLQPKRLLQQQEAQIDALLYQKNSTYKYATGYTNPMDE